MATSRLRSSPCMLVVVGLALALGGCSTTQPRPDPQRPFADGVLVDGGVANGVEWSVRVFRQDAQICSAVTIGNRERHGLSCSDLPPRPVNFRSAWFAGEVPLILFRLLEPNVAAVRLLVGDEAVIVPTTSLATLGANLRAVAVGFPAGVRVDGLVYLAFDGTELGRDVAAIQVPDGAAGDAFVTFVDGDATVNVGEHCGARADSCVIQVGPDH